MAELPKRIITDAGKHPAGLPATSDLDAKLVAESVIADDPEGQNRTFELNRTTWAAALGTFGVPITPKRILDIEVQSDSGIISDHEMLSFQYPSKFQVPCGYRNQANTFFETTGAAQLIRHYDFGSNNGRLRKWFPDHPFLQMMRSYDNFVTITEQHLPQSGTNPKPVKLWRVLPPDLPFNSSTIPAIGQPHYQLHVETSWNAPAITPDESKMCCVTSMIEAAALSTIGYEFEPTISRHGRRESGNKLTPRAVYFYEDSNAGQKCSDMLRKLREWKDGNAKIIDPVFSQLQYAYMMLINYGKVSNAAKGESANLMIWSPPNSGKKGIRMTQVHEDAFKREEDQMMRYLKTGSSRR